MSRDLAKTLSFACLHLMVGFTVTYAFTGSIAIASGVALVEPLVNTVVFYFHELGWRRTGHSPRDSASEHHWAPLRDPCAPSF